MRQLKIFLSIYYFSLPDEGGENKIYQFLGFSVYFCKYWLRQGGLSFYGSQKGDKGADTDLIFQFCLPYIQCLHVRENSFRTSLLFTIFYPRIWYFNPRTPNPRQPNNSKNFSPYAQLVLFLVNEILQHTIVPTNFCITYRP